MNNLLVAQSGGPTSAINATLAGVIAQAMIQDDIDEILGGLNGIEGILQERIMNLREVIKNTSDLDRLTHTPASALGSCRFKLNNPETDESQYQKLIEIFKKYKITYFIYIGGNDSMDTVDKLSHYCEMNNIDGVQIIGAPKTIDNDLVELDHCPGFPSAAQYIATTFAELERDVSVYDSFGVTVVEIMGRNAGWLTASSALARKTGGRGPDFIYLCEKPFSTQQFLQDLKSLSHENRNLLVAVSEGLKDENGTYISETSASDVVDVFGHKDIAGTGKVLEQLIRNEIGCKVRSLELNLMQRCASHLTSQTDLEESRMLGAKAVQCALAKKSGLMVTLVRKQNNPYEITFASVPVSKVANLEKTVPMDWITDNGYDVTSEMMDYLSPLVSIDAVDHLIIK